MDRWQIGMCALALIFISLVPCSDAHADKNLALTLYYEKMTDADLTGAATFNFEFENAYLIDLGVSRRLYTFQNYFDIETESQIAKHFGEQDNWEFNLVAYFRWLLFPWDAYLDTSFAAGAGLSYATAVPGIEAKHYEDTARFPGALMFEFAFSLPQFLLSHTLFPEYSNLFTKWFY